MILWPAERTFHPAVTQVRASKEFRPGLKPVRNVLVKRPFIICAFLEQIESKRIRKGSVLVSTILAVQQKLAVHLIFVFAEGGCLKMI